MVYVKICGLREAEHARLAVSLGADAVGVVMSEGSPRNASAGTARTVVRAVRESSSDTDVVLVARGLPAEDAARAAIDLGFDVLQLHGSYDADDFAAALGIIPRVWRAASLEREPRVRPGEYGEEHLLLDAATPGSGERWTFDGVDAAALGDSWILAGGLSPDNVAASIAACAPWGVDVSSGIERAPGVKDPALIAAFIAAARAAG